MKAVMLSIQPKWCELIASGKKTIEVRKTAPKLQTPFKCYIYCTKDQYKRLVKDTPYGKVIGSGKVIGEFVCDYIKTFITDLGNISVHIESLKQTTLTLPELITYSGNKSRVYGWHISDLKIYDTPKELREFKRGCKKQPQNCPFATWEYSQETEQDELQCCKKPRKITITRPPQSYCYVEELSE